MTDSWTLGDLVLALTALTGTVTTVSFIVAYARRSGMAWTTSHAGRYLMIHHGMLAVLFGIILLNRFIPEWPGRKFVTSVVLIGFVIHSFSAYRLVRQSYDQKEAVMETVDGSKKLFRDSKLGNLVNGGLTFAALWLASTIGRVDFTPLPDVIEAFVIPAAATAAGLLVSWATARRKAASAKIY